jgi:hypothetical protein
LAETYTNGSVPACSSRRTISATSIWITNAVVTDETAHTPRSSFVERIVSPGGAWLSMTTSAMSARCFPVG